MIRRMRTIAACGILLAAALAAQDARVEQGGRLFAQACAGCHGPDGNQVAGIDLGRLQLRRAMADDEIARIIRSGIPGSAMTASNNITEEQAGTVVAYLHAEAASRQNVPAGDAARGQALFAGKGQCQNCHRVRGTGGRLGPDLSEIGAARRAAQLEKSILDPDAEILAANRPFRVVTKDGATVNGKLLNQDTFTVQMLDSREQLRSFVKTDLKEYAFVDKSPMPSYRERLSAQELADVVNYLASLRPAPISSAGGRGGPR
jgi:putative heme-binding domain-containing protein